MWTALCISCCPLRCALIVLRTFCRSRPTRAQWRRVAAKMRHLRRSRLVVAAAAVDVVLLGRSGYSTTMRMRLTDGRKQQERQLSQTMHSILGSGSCIPWSFKLIGMTLFHSPCFLLLLWLYLYLATFSELGLYGVCDCMLVSSIFLHFCFEN